MSAKGGDSEQYSTSNQSMSSDPQSQFLFQARIIKVTPHDLLYPGTLLTKGNEVNWKCALSKPTYVPVITISL